MLVCVARFLSPATSKLSPQSLFLYAYFSPFLFFFIKIAFNAIWFQSFDKQARVSPDIHVICSHSGFQYPVIQHTCSTYNWNIPNFTNWSKFVFICSKFNHYYWSWFHIFYTAFCWFHNYLALQLIWNHQKAV